MEKLSELYGLFEHLMAINFIILHFDLWTPRSQNNHLAVAFQATFPIIIGHSSSILVLFNSLLHLSFLNHFL